MIPSCLYLLLDFEWLLINGHERRTKDWIVPTTNWTDPDICCRHYSSNDGDSKTFDRLLQVHQ